MPEQGGHPLTRAREAASIALRRARTLAITSAVLGVTCPLSAAAYRPFDSTDAAVAGRGEVEIELGPLGFVAEGADRGFVVPGVVINCPSMRGSGWRAPVA